MTTKYTLFANYLIEQLKQREWRPSDLARVANINTGQLSRIMSLQRGAGPVTCTAIAHAFDVLPEEIFRRAGLLPPLPPAVEEEKEAVTILRRLSDQVRQTAIAILRTLPTELAQTSPTFTVTEFHPPYQAEYNEQPRTMIEQMAYEIAEGIKELPEEDAHRIFDLMKRLRGDTGAILK